MLPRFTLGIEEEFQLVDPHTRELKSHIEEMLAAGAHLGDQIKPELHRSVVEVGTPVCQDIREARDAVKHLRRSLISMAESGGVRIVAAGTHPISHWKDQEITDRARYTDIVNEMEDLARANLIFGLHVHVGIDDRDMQINIMNGVRAFLPHMLALSVNSPFWCGRQHGREVGPLHHLQALPAHADPGPLPLLGRLLELRGPARAHQQHRRRQEDLVGRAAPRLLQDPGVPDLRHPLAGRGDDRHRRLHPGPGGQAVPPARVEPVHPLSRAGRDRGEQVPRPEEGPGQQHDRLRPQARDAHARAHPGGPRLRGRRGGRARHAARDGLPARVGGHAARRAPTARSAPSRLTHDLRAVVDLLVDETKRDL